MSGSGIDGFLGTRASLMLDVVFVAMLAVVPVLAWSVWLIRRRKNYRLHKRVQIALSALLFVTVVVFELDMRFNPWRWRAEASPYYPNGVFASLYLHLFFAVTTTILWAWVFARAMRMPPGPLAAGKQRASHYFWGRLAAVDLVLTSITGWSFYYLAFVT